MPVCLFFNGSCKGQEWDTTWRQQNFFSNGSLQSNCCSIESRMYRMNCIVLDVWRSISLGMRRCMSRVDAHYHWLAYALYGMYILYKRVSLQCLQETKIADFSVDLLTELMARLSSFLRDRTILLSSVVSGCMRSVVAVVDTGNCWIVATKCEPRHVISSARSRHPWWPPVVSVDPLNEWKQFSYRLNSVFCTATYAPSTFVSRSVHPLGEMGCNCFHICSNRETR